MGQLNITEITDQLSLMGQLRMGQQQQQLRIVYFVPNKTRGRENFCTFLDLSTTVKVAEKLEITEKPNHHKAH